MKDIYQNNQEIVVFFNKAQGKIGELAAFSANEEEKEDLQRLLLDLSDFIECLDSIYCTYSITDVIRYIHFFNRRANLFNIPFIQITDYIVNIYTGGAANLDLSAVESLIRSILAKYPHNSLANLQGGSSLERYHVSKAMYDWIQCQMTKSPCPDIIQPAVSLSLISNGVLWPSGYYELGTSITKNTLAGFIQLNSGKSILSTKYYRNNQVITGTEVLNPTTNTVNSYMDTTVIKTNTDYSFEAVFEVGGSKKDSKSIQFLPPMYYGNLRRDQVTGTTVKTLTKDVRNVGAMDLTFTLPSGNTLITGGKDLTPVVEFPASFSIPSSIKVLGFEYLSDWTFTTTTNTLQDGTTVNVVRGVFKNSIEGVTTFNFSF